MSSASCPAPPEPTSLAETGLGPLTLRSIFLKTMFRQGLGAVSSLSRALCLPMVLTQELADQARQMHLIETSGVPSLGTTGEPGLHLTEAGRAQTREALVQSDYFGAVPVPLSAFSAQMQQQSIRRAEIDRSRLTTAMQHLILPPRLIDQLGPALSAGRSILFYGPPGNGKSSISAAIRDSLGGLIYVPHAVEYQGQVISVFDPVIHRAVPVPDEDPTALRRDPHRHDRRFMRCHRPSVVTGGELSLDMLDLTQDPVTRIYQAPLQMKSAGGVFIVDDLGRQKDPPQAMINRWIVPMETGYDILALSSGEKFQVPFDTLVIFSTNSHPSKIFDQAALRRIFFKIRIDGPSQEDFLKLLATIARSRRLPLDEEALVHLVRNKYPAIDNIYANYHAGFLVDQMVAICQFEGLPRHMSPELIDRAWSNLFIEESDVAN